MFNTLFNALLLASMALASSSDVAIQGHGNAWKYGTGGGIVGLVVLIIDIVIFRMPIPSPLLSSHFHPFLAPGLLAPLLCMQLRRQREDEIRREAN